MIRKIEIERFSLTTSKAFNEVVAGVNAAIGHPDMAEFGRSTHEARSSAELKSAVEKGLSKAGLMLFMQLDQGAVLQKETGQDTSRIIRFLIGNPLIMKEMAKHVPDAGSYAPVTVLVDERADGVHLSYDKMASFLEPYGNRDALEVARESALYHSLTLTDTEDYEYRRSSIYEIPARCIGSRISGKLLKVSHLVAREGVEPPTPAFSGPSTELPKWPGISGCH
jgi:uncharacterized protein (DUF302 family)